ncbi:MAG TPA: DUF4931 domain-containing protein [bacterium]
MPELRKDPLTRRWVIIATERAKGPEDFLPPHDAHADPAECPFCEGHEADTRREILAVRARPGADKPGWTVRVIPSVNPVLRIEGRLNRRAKGIYDVMDGIGAHEMIIESPKHVSNAADLSAEQLQLVVQTTVNRIVDLERDPRFRYVLWFKNHGGVAGAGRIDHTRSQLIATPVTPKVVKEELLCSRRYYEDKERCLMCDVIQQERESGVRVVFESPHIIALAPFASRFPFELCILPKRHSPDFARMRQEEIRELPVALKEVLSRLKTVLEDPPYNYLLHTAPFRSGRGRLGHWKTLEDDFHWHLELIPRLTRVAGFEWGTGFYINPTPPEEAARYLREAAAGAPPAPASQAVERR